MSRALDELAGLTADLKAHLDWVGMLGTEVLPREKFERVAGPPIQPSSAAQVAAVSSPKTASRVQPVIRKAAESPKPEAEDAVVPPPQEKGPPEKQSTMTLSSKWTKVMETPSACTVRGPTGAPLMIVRGAGSSGNAEAMLDRMLENVLGFERSRVAVVDVVRDDRAAADLSEELRSTFSSFKPGMVLVMGVHAARLLLGAEAGLSDVRGVWHELSWSGGGAPMRVTHHPDGILALAERGQSGARYETFDDLKAVKERLS